MRRRVWRSIERTSMWIVLFFAMLGYAIVASRSKLLWAGLVVAGIIVPVFLIWVAFALLSYYYVRTWYRDPTPWRRW